MKNNRIYFFFLHTPAGPIYPFIPQILDNTQRNDRMQRGLLYINVCTLLWCIDVL